MKVNPGFSLIEIVIAFAIASVLSISLYQLLKQTTRIVGTINNSVDVGEDLMSFYPQIEKDISAMAIPISSARYYDELFNEELKQQNNQKSSESQKDQNNLQNTNAQNSGSQNANLQNSDQKNKDLEEKKKNIIQDVFFLENKKDSFLLSFITTGGLSEFDVKNGFAELKVGPTLKRVAYELTKETDGTSILKYRISRTSLDISSIRKTGGEEYILLSGVKNFSITLTVFEPIDSNNKQKTKAQNQSLEQWDEDMIKKYKSLVPAYIEFRGQIDKDNQVTDFDYKFKIYSYKQFVPEKDSQEKKDNPENGSLNSSENGSGNTANKQENTLASLNNSKPASNQDNKPKNTVENKINSKTQEDVLKPKV